MKKTTFILLGVVLIAVGVYGFSGKKVESKSSSLNKYGISKYNIAQSLEKFVQTNTFPADLEVTKDGVSRVLQPVYTLNDELQTKMQKMLQQYKPDFGAFIAIDAKTGRILTATSFSREQTEFGNILMRATFPAASVFKVVTAAAAIDQKVAEPSTIVPFNGANHTLYRRNVLKNDLNKWTRHISLREAFAKSINTVFGKVGIFFLKPDILEEYAVRFQFNREVPVDLPVQPGSFVLERDDNWKIAEAASGYNRVALMSPVQGALIAASIANDGIMMEPYIVDSLNEKEKGQIYKVDPSVLSMVVSPIAAEKLRSMMNDTVKMGTSAKTFRGFNKRHKIVDVEVGGKTGHLTGNYPKGGYDWFVGYGRTEEDSIAVAALTINEENWRVKSGYLARVFFENYFQKPHLQAQK